MVTFTLTVFVAVTVTVGAGSGSAVGVAVTVAVAVTVGWGLAASGLASPFALLSSAFAPMPMKKASPSAGSTYRLRAHFGAVRPAGGMYGLVMAPPGC
ncbi:hypothetical protein [Streptomyces pseudogriseolus]|uniref:hypothetical protein n=1 Tax=Streptomyces pseudogriseolus TaxID=36817 RepID=UPI003FA1FDD2